MGLFRRTKNDKKQIIRQIIDLIPRHIMQQGIQKYQADKYEAMMLPDLVNISEAKVLDSKGFERVVFPKNTIIIEDKGFWDFDVIKDRIKAQNTFVTRIKENTVYQSVEELDLPDQGDFCFKQTG